LAALFAISSLAFLVVKYLGAAYLFYLGIQAMRKPDSELAEVQVKPTEYRKLFRDGFVVALFNPKTAVFFATFLPQFMTPQAPPMPQSLALGALFVAIAGSTDTCYALAAGTVGPTLARARRVRAIGRYVTASAFIGLGVFTAFSGSRSGK
jgi:threonine/homoserine/homoserine lactone efflux protein